MRRLPPAHTLTCAAGRVRVERYWALPVDGDIRYRRPEEYAERLRELLRQAVGDRLRTGRVGVFMTGGMDSSSVAAVARRLLPTRTEPLDLQAFTVVYDALIPDRERYWTGLAARALNMPVHFLAADDYRLFEGQERPELHTPEPCHEPTRLVGRDLLGEAAVHGRVVLTGYGGDPAMLGSATYAVALLRSGLWGRLAADVWHALSRGCLA